MESYAPQNGPSSGEQQRPPNVAAALVISGLFVLVLGVVLASVHPPAGVASSAPKPSATVPSRMQPEPTTSAASTVASTATTIAVGALPQTDAKPTTTSPTFQRHARDLWNAVVTDDASVAMPFFFPRAAYVQIKAIADPSADWQNRLVSAFETDVHALHEQLGSDAADAVFVGLHVPDGQAQWIEPGVESNSGSYWRTYGSVLRYRVGATEHELPVTSLISWRGEWYVVHLGPIR